MIHKDAVFPLLVRTNSEWMGRHRRGFALRFLFGSTEQIVVRSFKVSNPDELAIGQQTWAARFWDPDLRARAEE